MDDPISYASCLQASDYTKESYGEDAIACIGNNAVLLSQIGDIFPSYQYQRPQVSRIFTRDPDFRKVIDEVYQSINRLDRISPGAKLVEIPAACVIRNVVYMAEGDAFRVVYETYRPNDRPYSSLMKSIDGTPISVQMDNRKFLYIGSAGSHNYGHWLVDDLPRLKAFFTIRKNYPSSHIVITLPGYSSILNSVRIEAIDIALSGDDNYSIFFISPDKIYSFGSLFYCSPVSFHPFIKSPTALSQTVSQFVKTPLVQGKPIFVERQSSRGRSLINSAALRLFLEELGFQHVDPDGMLFIEQVNLFARAPAVVGIMGAAMTNTMFCRPGTKLIYLAPDGWVEPFYWDLAAVCGHLYQVCFGFVGESHLERHLSSFTIDQNELLHALEHFSLA